MMITSPVRMYLLLLFVAVVGIGGYMLIKQQNDDYDTNAAQSGVSVKNTTKAKATPVATAKATAAPAATASPVSKIDTSAETASLDTLISNAPTSDFDTSSFTSTSLGL
jgi:uncharacterized protein HemX